MPFSPPDPGGLKVWLEIDSLGLSNNDPISTWTDLSGTSHNYTGSSTARPLYIVNASASGTKPVARFDGSNDTLSGGDLSAVFTSAMSFFMVFKTTDTTRMSPYESKNNDPWWSFDNAGYWGIGRSTRLSNTPSSGLGVTGWHLWSLTADGTNYKMWLDQVLKINAGSFTFDGGNAHTMGVQTANTHYTPMDAVLVLIYDNVLSAPDQASVEQYAIDNWIPDPNATVASTLVTGTSDAFAPLAKVTIVEPLATATAVGNAPAILTPGNVTIAALTAAAVSDVSMPAVTAASPIVVPAPAAAFGYGINEVILPTAAAATGTRRQAQAVSALVGSPSSGGSPSVGAVEHVVLGPDGAVDYPIIGDWECDEQVPGGFWTATGLIAKAAAKTHLSVYTYGAAWQTYDAASGDLIWGGRLLAPQAEEGQIRLNAEGSGKRTAERAIRKRLLYQTRDLSEWTVGRDGAPFSNDPGNTLETTMEETGQDAEWAVTVDNGLRFVRPGRDVTADTNSATVRESSAPTIFYGEDLAEPGLTRMAFTAHVFANTPGTDGYTSGRPSAFMASPWPIYMRVQAGRWDQRLAFSSQGGFGSPNVIWYPDWDGAGGFNYGENFNWWMRWNIDFYYEHTVNFTGGSGYSPTGGYSPAPYAFSDRVGNPSEDEPAFWAGATDTGIISQEDGNGRRWDNRPFTRPVLNGSAAQGAFEFLSTNFADPGTSGPADFPTSPYFDYWETFPKNYIEIEWADHTSAAASGNIPTSKASLFEVRVNGIAPGDFFSATDLMQDLALRLGCSTSYIEQSSVNILPYDVKEGTWGDALDHGALMTGWVWRIMPDPEGGRSQLQFFPWQHASVWEVTDDRTPTALYPVETFNSVDVPFRYTKAGRELTGQAHVRWRNAPPAPGGDYGLVELDQPLHNREQAEVLGHRLLEALRKHRKAGSMTVTTAVWQQGFRESAFLIHAGDGIDYTPSGVGNLRIRSLRKTYEGVELEFEDQNVMVDAIIARKNQRLSVHQH